MATVHYSAIADRGETRFFFTMACVMSATIVAGFSLNVALGRSTFAAPLLFHVHAVIMMGWLAIYLAQNALVLADNIALHRRLGWIAVAWVPMMVATGTLMTGSSLRRLGAPPFFDQNQFLISNPLLLLCFAGTTAWAIAVRKNTGWHRRLMYCAFAGLTGPGLGRLLPMPFLIPYAWYVAALGGAIVFIGIGALADRRRYGRIHPAWGWGLGILLATQLVADLIAYSPLGRRFTEDFIAGTPGDDRQPEAFFPPM